MWVGLSIRIRIYERIRNTLSTSQTNGVCTLTRAGYSFETIAIRLHALSCWYGVGDVGGYVISVTFVTLRRRSFDLKKVNNVILFEAISLKLSFILILIKPLLRYQHENINIRLNLFGNIREFNIFTVVERKTVTVFECWYNHKLVLRLMPKILVRVIGQSL